MSSPIPPPVSGAWATTALPGERYERTVLLGQGGMGSVWRARDTVLNRDVAYKTLAMDASPELRERLIQEARIAANLAGTGAVAVFDQGSLADGRPFYTMEVLDFPAFGEDPASNLRRVLEVARTVAAAHERGIVHRDIKASNVGLSGDRAVLADWGLARPTAHDAEWDSSILTQGRARTATGQTMGTAGYMAPELLTGAPPSPRSDVWSLGALLAEQVDGVQVSQSGSHGLLASVVAGALDVPPSAHEQVLRRALALDPADRYPDARSFAVALEAAMVDRAPRWRAGGTSILTLVLLAGVGLTALAWFGGRSTLQRSAAEAVAQSGWIVYSAGQHRRARELGGEAQAHADTPWAAGLLAIPTGGETVASAFPTDCVDVVFDSAAAQGVCVRADSLSLVGFDGQIRWQRAASDVRRVRVVHGLTTYIEGYRMVSVEASGESTLREMIHGEDAVVVDGTWWLRIGRSVGWVSADATFHEVDGVYVDQLGPPVDEVVPYVGHGVLSVLTATDPANRAGPGLAFPELIRTARRVGDTVVLVGERGLVVHVDGASWEERSRHRLPVTGSVHAAAIGPDGGVVVSLTSGVYRFERGALTDQVSTVSASSVSVLADGTVWMRDGDGVRSWRRPRGRRHVILPFDSGTSTLYLRGEQLLAGSMSGEVAWIDRTQLDHRVTGSAGESVHSVAVGADGVLITAAGTTLRMGPEGGPTIDHVGHAAVLSDGTIVGVGRYGSGVSWVVDGQVRRDPSTPVFRDVTREHGGEYAIARTNHGELWRIDADRTVSSLGVSGVDRIASGPIGLALARGSVVSLDDAWTVDVGEPVTALWVGPDAVWAGTMQGAVHQISPSGTPVRSLQAHTERVTSIVRADDALFTGSWQRGIRRWQL